MMYNKTPFSISLDDFQKLMLYSLQYPHQKIPGLPPTFIVAKLIGEPTFLVAPQFNPLQFPKGCCNLMSGRGDNKNLIKSEDGTKVYDALHVPDVIRALQKDKFHLDQTSIISPKKPLAQLERLMKRFTSRDQLNQGMIISTSPPPRATSIKHYKSLEHILNPQMKVKSFKPSTNPEPQLKPEPKLKFETEPEPKIFSQNFVYTFSLNGPFQTFYSIDKRSQLILHGGNYSGLNINGNKNLYQQQFGDGFRSLGQMLRSSKESY